MTAVGTALGRDPLQLELTPYEVLGVERAATAVEVEHAFRGGLIRRASVQKLTTAKIALQRGLERAVIDLFLYDPDVLFWLQPSPLSDPGSLEPEQRARTAQQWEALLGGRFPDLRIAHSLAVFWYWWAVGEGDRPDRPGDPPHEERWRRAIGYWSMVLAHVEFWRGRATGVEARAVLRGAVLERLAGDLRKLPPRAHASGRSDCADLELLLANECAAARALYATDLRTPHGRLSCGPLMLRHYGILGSVRAQLGAALERAPRHPRLGRLLDMLSEHAHMRALLAAGKPADALAALEALPATERGTAELKGLRARAWLELGREQASVQEFDDALWSWAQGLDGAAGDDVEQELRGEVVTACRTRASGLARRPEEAIGLLERALALVRDDSLALALAQLLLHRGAGRALAAKQRLDAAQRISEGILESLGEAHVDLERAAQLGSEPAREDADLVRDLIAQATAPRDALPVLRTVLRERGVRAPLVLRERAAALLAQRGSRILERVAQRSSGVRARRGRAQEAALVQMRIGREQRGLHGLGCDLCALPGGVQLSTLALPEEPPFMLCQACARELRPEARALARRPLALLETAERDLAEAAELGAGGAVAARLDGVRQLREKIFAAAARSAEQARSGRERAPGERTQCWVDALYAIGFLLILLYVFQRC